MAGMTDYLEDKLRGHVLLGVAYTQPVAVYLALFSDATGDDGTGTEATGGSYSRQAVTFAVGAGPGDADSDAAVTFANMPAGTWTHAALFDSAGGGNMLMHGPLGASKTTGTGDDLVVEAGDVSASFD